MSDKKSKFGIGVAFGAVLGGLAAFFLSPRSGPENREMAKKTMSEIDRTKYKDLVVDVIGRLKEEKDATQERLVKLQDYFLKRFTEGAKMAKKDAVKVAEGVTHAVKNS